MSYTNHRAMVCIVVAIGAISGFLGNSSARGQDPPKVLLHVGNVLDPGSDFQGADAFVLNHLTKDLQFDVTLKFAGDIEEGEYDTFDGIVFSPTNNSGDGRGKGIKTTTTPVFNWEDSLYKDTEGDFYFQEAAKRGVALPPRRAPHPTGEAQRRRRARTSRRALDGRP